MRPAARDGDDVRVGLYAWTASSGRRTRWHVYAGRETGRTLFACGVSLLDRPEAQRKLTTQIVRWASIEKESMAADRICKGCLIHASLEFARGAL